MGLDAWVYCDCFEKGFAKEPPQPEFVYIDESGDRCLRTEDPVANEGAFDA